MREWPSIVSGTPEDYYIVVNHYGRFGTAFAETDLDGADYETTIADLMSGQHCDPLRVVMLTPTPTTRGMFHMPSRRKYSAASALKIAACRQCWRISLIAMWQRSSADAAAGADVSTAPGA
jgi:hypothetical protein